MNGSNQRIGLSAREAAEMAGIGLTRFYEAIQRGEVKARKLGRRTLILRSDLENFLEALPAKTQASEAHRGYVRRRWDGAKSLQHERVNG